VRAASLTDVGLKRSHNEDNLIFTSLRLIEDGRVFPYHICMVSDGMGGAAAGEVASRLTIEMVSRRLFGGLIDAHADRNRAFINPDRLLLEAVEVANRKVFYTARSTHLYAGMGATVTIALIAGGRLTIGNVGDSRCYRFRQGVLTQLTDDHSFVNELVKDGRLTPEQAAGHPRRNVITRAIGSREKVLVDLYHDDAESGDLYLFCSDGLSGMLRDQEMEDILGSLRGKAMTDESLNDTCHLLVARANEAGGKDNISVVLAGIEYTDIPEDRSEPLAIRQSKTLTWDEAIVAGFRDAGFVEVDD